MSSVPVSESEEVRLTLFLAAASSVALDCLQGRESPLQLTVNQAEALAEALQPGWKRFTGGPPREELLKGQRPVNAAHAAAWTAALIGIVKRSGAPVQERPTCDDVALAAQHLGVDISELLDAAELEARYGLVDTAI